MPHPGEPSRIARRGQGARRRRILLVDDSESFLLALRANLEKAGYRDVVVATSGREALSHLLSVEPGAAGEVDLILMDLVMPGMNGIEAVRRIKTHDRLKDIPIVMVSGKDDESQIERAFDAGAMDYIGKPPKELELRARVASALKLKTEMDRRKEDRRKLELLNRSLEQANVDLERISRVDGLTGVANRRFFDEMWHREWSRAQRDGRPLSVIIVDIDHFKLFNDHYGHMEGDTCLRRVAGILKQTLRRGGDFLARYGGEEFVIILPDATNDGAMRLAERIRRNVEQERIEHCCSETDDRVTVSAGFCTVMPDQVRDPEVVIRAADSALYEAKNGGRNRICGGWIEEPRPIQPRRSRAAPVRRRAVSRLGN